MSKEEKKPVEVSYEVLKALVEEGKTKGDIEKHFGLSPVITAKLLKEANLKPKRAVVPAFVLIKSFTSESEVVAPVEAREASKVETKKEKATKEKVEKAEKVVESKVQVENDSDLLQVTNKVDEQESETKEETTTENDW